MSTFIAVVGDVIDYQAPVLQASHLGRLCGNAHSLGVASGSCLDPEEMLGV